MIKKKQYEIVDIIPLGDKELNERIPKSIIYNSEKLMLFEKEKLINEVIINSVNDILSFTTTDIVYSFRGQANSNWPLKTSIERFFEDRTLKIAKEEIEKKIILKYKSEFSIYSQSLGYDPATQNILDTISDIQHFGGPTRFLDWTKSFNIALFFAIFNNYTNENAVVYCLRNIVFNSANYDITEFFKQQGISSELEKTLPPPLEKGKSLKFYTPKRKNERIINQQGYFIYPEKVDVPFEKALSYSLGNIPIEYYKHTNFDIEEIIKRSGFIKIIIPRKIMNECRLYIKNAGISMKTLFPDMTGAIQSLYEIETDKF